MTHFVRTVLGDISPDELGFCYAHEHLIIDASYTTAQTPDFLLDDVDLASSELIEVKRLGAGALVDSMPMACGRNVTKLAEISRRSQLHILCPTGLHLRKYYPPVHWCDRVGVEELAELFVREITLGIDTNDANGPERNASAHRAGLIKIASSLDAITPHENKIFRAAAIAHKKTGAPILTHTEQGTFAMEQIEVLGSLGVDLRHVVLSHTDRRPDVAYHRSILRSGVRIEYDSAYRWKPGQGNPTRDLVLALAPEFPDQIMLGMDAARRSYWKCHGGFPGMAFLIEKFVPELRSAGVTDDLLHRIFFTTPASAYQFKDIRS